MADFRLSQNIQQQQRLSMTPKMLQALNILSLPAEDLRTCIYEEVQKNPVLEITKEPVYSSMEIKKKKESFPSDENTFNAFIENSPSQEITLQEHLLVQLHFLKLDEKDIAIGEKIIQNLDYHGFYQEPVEALLTPNETIEDYHKMLEIIQNFDPLGICCSNIQESLLLQARHKKNAPKTALFILEHFFHLLEYAKVATFYKKLQNYKQQWKEIEYITLDDIEESIDFIKTLDVYPARNFFSPNTTQFIYPDVYVTKAREEDFLENGTIFQVQLAKSWFPQVGISKDIEDFVHKANNKVSKELEQALNSAQWFLNSLEQRNETLLKTVWAIIHFQNNFFHKGPLFLTPLRLKDVADLIGVHETTISRIANGKYIQCEHGIFEIKYFFSSNVYQNNKEKNPSQNTLGRSKESVKHELKKIIQEQSEKNPDKKLSDEKLSQILKSRGIDIARRTVAKYRQELEIQSSYLR